MPPFLTDLFVRAAALLAGAWLVAAAVRRRSASVRALAWSITFVGLLLLPVLTMAVPSWRVAVWPAVAPQASPARHIEAPSDTVLPQSGTQLAAARVAIAGADAVASRNIDVSRESISASRASVPTGRGRSAADSLLWIYLAISVALTLRLAATYRATTRLARSSDSDILATSDWLHVIQHARAELGISHEIGTRITDRVNVPAIAGIWRPVLLLPVDAIDWPVDVRHAVVLHELAHVVRRDAVSQLAGSLACALYWFVPPVWIAAHRAAILRERASDDVVLRAGVRPSTYANNLIDLVRQATGTDLESAALAMARPSRMRERVAAILDPVTRRDPVPARRGVVFATAAAGVVLGAASLTLVAREATTTAPAAARERAQATPTTVAPAVTRPLAIPNRTATVAAPSAMPNADNSADAAQARPTTPDRTLPFCDKDLSESSSSLHETDGRRTMTVKFTGRNCSVDLRTEGKIDYNADFTDVAAVSAGGFFKLDVTDNGVRRQLDIQPGNGQLVRTFKVDGREQPWDSAAREWFAAFLIALDRHTAIGVDIRLPMLLKSGGVDAVLAETALMSGDYARDVYFKTLFKTTKLSPADVSKLLKQASALAQSDYYAAQIVDLVAGRLDDATVRTAAAQLIARIKSDYYLGESIGKLVSAGRPSGPELDLLLKSTTAISSDYYRQQVLSLLLRSQLSGDQLAAVIQAGTKIGSDHYATEFLKSVLGAGALSERDLLSLVAVAKRLGSDHYKSLALVGIASHRSATEAVRTAVLDAAASMSTYYNDQVKRSVKK